MCTTTPAETTALNPCDACGRHDAETDEVLCPPCKAQLFPTAGTVVVGRLTYRVQRLPGATMPYALVGPRGGLVPLVRNVHDRLLRSIDPRFARRVFTDASGAVELRVAS